MDIFNAGGKSRTEDGGAITINIVANALCRHGIAKKLKKPWVCKDVTLTDVSFSSKR
jgi:hypothetical protein